MTKYKATITCDKETWVKFKNWATRKSSSASEEIEKFMLQCIQQPEIEQQDYLTFLIREIVKETLTFGNFELREKYKKRNSHEALAEKGTQRSLPHDMDSTDNQPGNTDNTDDTDSNIRLEHQIAVNHAGDTGRTPDSSNTDNTDDTDKKKTQIISDLEVSQETGISISTLQQYRFANRIPKLQQDKLKKYSFDLQGWYSTDNTEKKDKEFLTDRELKEKLNLTQHKSTIMRWRRGLTRTPDFVAEKYQIEEGKWVKVN